MAKNRDKTITTFNQACRDFIDSLIQLEDKNLGKKQKDLVLSTIDQVLLHGEIAKDHLTP